jgi:hypothetical protein
MGMAYSTNGGEEECIQDIGGKTSRKKLLGRSRRRWVHTIKRNLTEIRWGCMNWIDLAQNRDERRALVNMVMNFRIP